MTPVKPSEVWKSVPWQQFQRNVFRLQKRSYRAKQRGDVRTVHNLQRRLLRSRSARFVAVRRVSQDNRGKKTPGVDGVASLTPKQRLKYVHRLRNLDRAADPVRRIPIGRFWGVRVLMTPLTWLGPFVFFGLHLLLNLFNSHLSLTERLYQALIFTIAVEITTVLHAFGHILSGKMVHSAMDELLITSTRDVNLYHGDQSIIPGRIHLVRSLGGPLFNLFVTGVCLGVAPVIPPGFGAELVASLIATNLFFGIGSFLPLPSVDGEVIWRELLRQFRSAFK